MLSSIRHEDWDGWDFQRTIRHQMQKACNPHLPHQQPLTERVLHSCALGHTHTDRDVSEGAI
eukprot:1156851-Pelagomonas_calceolata.AAC.6